jgi:hypothetical protein
MIQIYLCEDWRRGSLTHQKKEKKMAEAQRRRQLPRDEDEDEDDECVMEALLHHGFKLNDEVIIQGLRTSKLDNGKTGRISKFLDNRVAVTLPGGRILRVRYENIRMVPPPPLPQVPFALDALLRGMGEQGEMERSLREMAQGFTKTSPSSSSSTKGTVLPDERVIHALQALGSLKDQVDEISGGRGKTVLTCSALTIVALVGHFMVVCVKYGIQWLFSFFL